MSAMDGWRDELARALMVPAALLDDKPASNLAHSEQASVAFRNQLARMTSERVVAIGWELVRMYEREQARKLYQRWHDDGIALAQLRQRLEEHFARWCS